ncbi:MAG: hypothetical protein PHY93_00685 [Bacteriovorax sp.]|nr:hypothetical protein [Bacteriovorax sp.]
MKNTYKISLIILILSGFSACSVKTTASKSTTATGVAPIVDPLLNIPLPSDSGSITGCDGVYRAGANRCYYKNIPTVLASGGIYGQTWWSSTTNFLSNYPAIDPSQFSTDATFNIRIIPRYPTANAFSTFNKQCSSARMYATKLKVQFILHESGTALGNDIATLTSTINTPSKVYHFTPPSSSGPLVLEVVNVESDSSCSPFYGTNYPAKCATSDPYLPIPINAGGKTECVAFDIQYSTDSTYDVPGSSAN